MAVGLNTNITQQQNDIKADLANQQYNVNTEIDSLSNTLSASINQQQQIINSELQVLDQDLEADLASSIIYAFSPTAKVELLPNGNYLITITDKNGTTTAQIPCASQEQIGGLVEEYLENSPILNEYIQAHNISDSAHEDIRNLILAAVNSIPTRVSQLQNDSGYVRADSIPEGSVASTTVPKMNGVADVGSELAFARGDHVHPSDVSKVSYFSDTTANWLTKTSLISTANVFYIYTDHEIISQNGNTIKVAGVKIGDGTTYVVDLPFITVTNEEKEFWNNKVRCYLSSLDFENLVFTTH